jgi:DHA1 family purine ribonucleoside efflux pump-like MFS transporter
MTPSNATSPQANQAARPNWSAVFAVAFCVACLITVEFLPVSLLTPMAQDLGISEGVAGQSVTTTAFVAMFASLFITSIIRNTDRRYVVILFSVLLTLSCLLVSFANSFYCCWAAPAWVWRWAAFGRCRRRSPCGWCRCAWCPKRYRLFSARYR